MISRRGLLAGLGAALAAPAIVRAEWIMPVRSILMPPQNILYLTGEAGPEIFMAEVGWKIVDLDDGGSKIVCDFHWVSSLDAASLAGN